MISDLADEEIMMRLTGVKGLVVPVVLAMLVSGCGHRYLSPRSTNPLIEDRVRMGDTNRQKMSVLTSRADRRTILIFDPERVCAEPPPDVAEAVYSNAAIELSKDEDTKASANSTLQTALLQLTRRSQGLEYFRTGSFVHCMMYYNGAYGPHGQDSAKSLYRTDMVTLLTKAVSLTEKELEHLPVISSAIVQVALTGKSPADAAGKPEKPDEGATDKQSNTVKDES